MALSQLAKNLFYALPGTALVGSDRAQSQHLSFPTDLRWSRDGASLVICCYGLHIGTPPTVNERATAMFSNAAGDRAFVLRKIAPSKAAGKPVLATAPRAPLCAEVTSDGSVLSGGSDGIVRAWTRFAEPKPQHELIKVKNAGISAMRLQPGGRTLAFLAGNNVYRVDLTPALHAASAGDPVELPGDGFEPQKLAWSDDGAELAVLGFGRVALYDADGKLSRTLVCDKCEQLAWGGGNLYLAGEAGLFRCVSGGEPQLIRAVAYRVAALTASSDGKMVALVSERFDQGGQSNVTLVDCENGEQLAVPWPVMVAPSCNIEFSPTGDSLAWVDSRGQLVVVPWNVSIERDPARERLDELRTLLESGKPEAALAGLKTFRVPSYLGAAASVLKSSCERIIERNKKRTVETAPDTMAVGAQVSHSTFGTGTVAAVSGKGAEARVTVKFSDAGDKVLQARFLQLQPASSPQQSSADENQSGNNSEENSSS